MTDEEVRMRQSAAHSRLAIRQDVTCSAQAAALTTGPMTIS
jgi:hypothetical protein